MGGLRASHLGNGTLDAPQALLDLGLGLQVDAQRGLGLHLLNSRVVRAHPQAIAKLLNL